MRDDGFEHKRLPRSIADDSIRNTKGLITDYATPYQHLRQSMLLYFAIADGIPDCQSSNRS